MSITTRSIKFSSYQDHSGTANRSFDILLSSLPKTLAEFLVLPQAIMQSPFDTAALTVTALTSYSTSQDETIGMLNYLRGPNNLMSNRDLAFLRDRMAQNNKAGFLGASYFTGASPENDYTPSVPYIVRVSENPYSYSNAGYTKLYICSGGADSPRPVTLRLAKDYKWYLWEYSSLLLDIRAPESTNPWAF